jgi:RNA polymerase sigma-70 factor (ECF subfamily)
MDYAAWFDDYYDSIASYLRARQVDRATAEDIAVQTFLEPLEGRATYDPEKGSPRVWLLGIATNLMRHHFRAEQTRLRAHARATGREVEWTDLNNEAIDRIDGRARSRALAAALATLDRADYEALALHCWADLTHGEVAQALGISVSTVKRRLDRSRVALIEQLGSIASERDDG